MAIARYIIAATIVLAAKLFVYLFAWLLAFFVIYRDEDYKPVATRMGIKRPFLIPVLYPLQTFDDALDSYWWWESKSAWLRKWFDDTYYKKHAWLRYVCRVLWLWRNPAYGIALKLGYDQTGIEYEYDNDPVDTRWDSKQPCRLMRKFTNSRGQKGFLFRYRSTWLELVFGYKVPWSDEKNAMVAVRFKIRT